MIGPMVIAGVVIDEKDEKKLKALGVRDSKKLSPKQRETLAPQIEKIARNIVVLSVPSCKINTYMEKGINLNKIEAMKMAEIINTIPGCKKIYIDSLSPPYKKESKKKFITKFEKSIRKYISNKNVKMTVKNHLDEIRIVVSAASVIAKVQRDKTVDKIKQEVNFDFGNGYPYHVKTIKFLEKTLQKDSKPSPHIRWQWSSVADAIEKLSEQGIELQPWVRKKILKEESWQRKIKDFFKRLK